MTYQATKITLPNGKVLEGKLTVVDFPNHMGVVMYVGINVDETNMGSDWKVDKLDYLVYPSGMVVELKK